MRAGELDSSKNPFEFVDDYMTPFDPYAAVEHWWGEPISTDLIRKVRAAPRQHHHSFFMDIHEEHFEQLPKLDPGNLRPAIFFDSYYQNDLEGYLQQSLSSLLYCHEVLLEDPLLTFDVPGGVERFGDILEVLLQMRPLTELGIARFVRVSGLARFPVTIGRWFRAIGDESVPLAMRQELFRASRRIEAASSSQAALAHFQASVGASLNFLARWPGQLHVVTRSNAEDMVLRLALGHAYSRTAPDHRRVRLQKLLAVGLPDFATSLPGLVEIRKNDEDFQRWRNALTNALNDIAEISDADESWRSQASEILAGELAPIKADLEKAVSRSRALSSFRAGTKKVVLAGAGATAGALAGDDLLSGLIGATVAPAFDLIADFVQARRERRRSKAVLDLTLQFSQLE